jgi:hypothetical protein
MYEYCIAFCTVLSAVLYCRTVLYFPRCVGRTHSLYGSTYPTSACANTGKGAHKARGPTVLCCVPMGLCRVSIVLWCVSIVSCCVSIMPYFEPIALYWRTQTPGDRQTHDTVHMGCAWYQERCDGSTARPCRASC